jgi:hypothetical protein
LLVPVNFAHGVCSNSFHSSAGALDAFKERCKIHDLIMEGVGMALRKRGYPAMDDLKSSKQR